MSDIYKSRLFNFFNRQKIRLSNQLGITWRNLQLATETGVKFLLYPIYLIARTSISGKQQLSSDNQGTANQAKFVEGNISSENDLWLEDKDQILAGNIGCSNDSAILNANQQVNSQLTKPRSDKTQAIAPIRFFQKIVNWVKHSPVATKLNLFEEANLESDSFHVQNLISRAIAYFFGNKGNKQKSLTAAKQEALPSYSSPETTTIQLSQVNSPAVINSSAKTSPPTIFSKINNWLEKAKLIIVSESNLVTELTEQDIVGIQGLMRRAITYFFGNKQKLLSGNKQKAISSSHNPNHNLATTLPFATVNILSEAKTLSVTLPFNSWNLKLPNININPDNIDNQITDISITKNQLTELETATLNIFSANILSTDKTSLVNLNNIPLEFSSDFWEAEVITVGYVKNILEKILEFLDKITWWIEKQFVKLWRLVNGDW